MNYVQFRLTSRTRAAMFLALVALAVVAGAAETTKIATLTALGRSTDVSKVRRGLALDPDSAELHHRLGQLYCDSLAVSDLAEGVTQARRATALNPNRFEYWQSLASACESVRDYACADQALQRLLVLRPMAPQAWWVAGDHYLRTGRPDLALPCFRRLFELSPDYVAATLALTFRMHPDPEMIFEKVVNGGSNARLALAYADFMSAHNDFDAAHHAWSQVVSRGSTFTFGAVRPYLEQLLSHGRFQEAHDVWVDLEQQGAVPKPPDSEWGNLVFNGSFERPPLGAGFDWRLQPSPYVSVDFADRSAYEGAHCLRVDFLQSQNVEFEPAYQVVPVDPGRAYTLTAYLRTADITSECGPQLRVVDPSCSACLAASTDSTTGTTAWHSVQVRFTAGKQTRVVRLSVWRSRCRTFPMDISGSFWLDAVSLRPLPGAE